MSATDSLRNLEVISTPRTGNWIKRHPVFAVCFLSYAFFWIIAIPQVATLLGLVSISIPTIVALIVGTYGTLWAALIVEGAARGKAGIRELLSRLVRWRVGIRWYIIALFFPAAYLLAGVALNALLSGTPPKMPVMAVTPVRLLAVLLPLVGQAIFLNTEEFAWRGVALPRLQATRSALVATLILAVVEGLWHLPYFFVPQLYYQQVGLGWFMAWNIALAIVFTWVFNNTRGSLLIVILFHAAGMVWTTLLVAPSDVGTFELSTVVLCFIAVALVAIFGAKHLSHKSEAEIAPAIESR